MSDIIKAKSIDHINMTVKFLQESVEFYEKVFGFTLKKDQPGVNSQIIGNDHIKLCLYEDPNISIGEGINHFGFYVEDFDKILKLCETLGVKVNYDGEVKWDEGSRSLYIEDPNGYEIELSEKPGGGL